MSLSHPRPSRSALTTRSAGIPSLFGLDPWAAWSDTGVAPMSWSRADDALVLRVELPGVPGDEIEVGLEGDLLTLAVADAGEQPSGHRFSGFRRTLRVKEPFDGEHVSAAARDGVLTVTLRKAPESLPRRIPIQHD